MATMRDGMLAILPLRRAARFLRTRIAPFHRIGHGPRPPSVDMLVAVR